MAKIGTFEDFKNFATDKVGASPSVIDATVKDFITPFILEERKMNVTQLDVFSRLMYERIVFLSGEVTPESMNTITAQLLYLDSVDNRDINIYINTPGGDCYSGLQLVSVMDFIKSDVATTVLGMAASMGAVIASSGAKGKRFALPYSRFMIHQPSSYHGYAKFTDSKIALQEMESIRNDLYEVLAKNSGKSIEEIIQLCENGDKWYKSDEIIKAGFIDSIIQGNKGK
jgi:ATP-dependent Clp protease protease subunit